VVRNSRDAMPVAVIDAVAAKYEAEGWIVQQTGVGRDVRATIMMPEGHPDRTLLEPSTTVRERHELTNENEMRQDELAARRLLTCETRRTLDEVARHSLGRTGKVAHAIEAGLVALRDDAVLALSHREALEEFEGMASESTPSANGDGIGMRCVRWRDAVLALLGALRPDPLRELFTNLAASLTPQQAEQLARPLSEQQRGLFQQVVNLALRAETKSL
jgi:hypothetical protein